MSGNPRIHRHILAARTVVVAPRRADRPNDLEKPSGASAGGCPFCAGHESLTPPDLLRAPETADAPWHARIIPNRYPIVERLGGHAGHDPSVRPAHGIHDVVIESADHHRSILDIDATRWREVWALVQRRLAMLDGADRIAWATVFKNSGPAAGASLEHVHSQLIGLDFVPPVMEAELAAFREPGHSFGDLIRWAEAHGCVVADAADLVAMIPPAPRQPLETWILPREPEPHFHATSHARVAALADLTRRIVATIDRAAPGADYNWWLHQAPCGERAVGGWHWHLEILPRLAPFAGFELATGCHITTLSPEDSARRMAAAWEA